MIRKVSSWLAAFLELQLVIFLLSLPILISWGLAVSCMLPAANIIFTPLLTLFLWFSCIFTCSSLLELPCDWINHILHMITQVWHYLLSFAQPGWLIGFSYATRWLAIGIAIAVIIFYTRYKPQRKQALWFLLCCTTIIFATKVPTKPYTYHRLEHLNMAILTINNKTYVLDNGGLCSKHNYYSWIDYTILPTLIKAGGITTIDTLVLYKPSKKLIPVVEQFAQQTSIKRIFVTQKYDSYQKLYKHFQSTNIKVLPIKRY